MSQNPPIAEKPRVVAVLTSMDALARFASLKTRPCHLAEIRLDHIGTDAPWVPHCRSLQTAGTPVILTLRAAYEGGKWTGSEPERLNVLEKALPEVAAVDVELKSNLAPRLIGRGPQVIVSYHNFSDTPPVAELRDILRKALERGDVAKISTMIQLPRDIETLELLWNEKWPKPICVIGMGELGARTRTDFPRRGSCLTYGYFDSPAAPGQPSAAKLMELLDG